MMMLVMLTFTFPATFPTHSLLSFYFSLFCNYLCLPRGQHKEENKKKRKTVIELRRWREVMERAKDAARVDFC